MKTNKVHQHHAVGVRECAGVLLLAPYDERLVEEPIINVGMQPTLMAAVVEGRTGKKSLPKGGLKDGETPEAAARREFQEETGAKVKGPVVKLGVYVVEKLSLDGDIIGYKAVQVFLAFEEEPSALNPEEPDVTRAMWVPVEDLAATLSHPEASYFVRQSLRSYDIVDTGLTITVGTGTK